MKTPEKQKIQEFINDIQLTAPEKMKLINSIRRLFNEANQALTENIKYGGLVFFKSGSLIGGIFPYKKHISIEFSCGADFSDPSKLLEGNGKRRRHLKIFKDQDIDDKKASFFIKQAVDD
jgi:hypothetical protein